MLLGEPADRVAEEDALHPAMHDDVPPDDLHGGILTGGA
jgi:hypothetical protein